MHLELDEGYPAHPKTLRLCSLLKCETADAFPPRMWAWAVRAAKTGDLTGIDPAELEMAVRFRGKAGTLHAALVASGFIDINPDGTAEIHDWMDHTGRAIARMEAAADASRERKRRWSDRETERRRNGEGTRSERVPNAHQGVPGTYTDKTRPDQARQDQTRQEEDQIEICAETAAPSSPPLMVFPCDGPSREWALFEPQVAEWSELFPSLDVMGICRQALAWLKANPQKRKTASGMPRFLVAWFTRDQNRGVGRGATPIHGNATATRSDRNLDIAQELLAKESAG